MERQDRRDELEQELERLRRHIAELEEQRRQLERQLAEARESQAAAAMVPPTTQEELTQTLTRMLSRFARLLQAEACVIFVHRTDEDILILHPPTVGIEMPVLGALGTVPREGLVQHVFQQRVPVIVNDTRESRYPDVRILQEAGIRNAILVPLMWDKRDEEQRVVERKAIGVLMVANKRRQMPFSEEDRRILEILARQSASVIAGAQIYIELRERTEQLERAFESVSAGVILININGKIILVNHTALQAFCSGDGNVIGKPFTQVIHHDKVRSLLLTSLNEKTEVSDEVEIYEPEERIYRVETSLVRDELGNLTGVIALFSDITEIRRLERMKTEFVSTVSHELRTPLTSIKGFIATLLEDREGYFDAETRYEFYQIIDQETDRLRRLIEDLLNLSRIERGVALQPHWQRVDLSKVIERVLSIQRSYTDKHQLISDIPEDLPPIVADEDKIDGILTNLVNNAIKYSPNGGEVRVRAVREDNSILISVQDQGIGIPKDKLTKIFEKFERIDTKETRAAGGTGIGLYLVKHLVELHEGQIWAESEGVGKGATFYVRIPIYPKRARDEGYYFDDVEQHLHL